MKRFWMRTGMAALLSLTVLLPAGGAAEMDLLEVDHKLYELGYRDEACNGVLDEITVTALKNFQTVNGLQATGQADEETTSLLLSGEAMGAQEYLSSLTQYYTSRESLSVGSSGKEVSQLQSALQDLGYLDGEADGTFSEATAMAVRRFQMANGLAQDGIANGQLFYRLYNGTPVSWTSFLTADCASAGDSGAHVRQIQARLKYMGYFSGECTGKYGDGTQQAIKQFQLKNNLQSSGDVDLATCALLFSDGANVLVDGSALQRGSTGSVVDNLLNTLSLLGYGAGESYGVQTEIAVMQFQTVNLLPVSGLIDRDTAALLQSGSAALMHDENWVTQPLVLTETARTLTGKTASAMLGQNPGFESSFQFVQYVYIHSGVRLMNERQVSLEVLDSADMVHTGDALTLETADGEYIGIAVNDEAMAYLSQEGYVVMSYLDMMKIETIYRWVTEGHG